jgi:regulator of protease activity HflC (stomatin/prohibitin superfamily)
MKKSLRLALSVVGVFLLSSLLTGCSTSAPVDKMGLKYGGGPIEGNHFEGVVESGSGAQVLGPFDNIVWLPAGQRNYIISKNAEEGDRQTVDFVSAPAKGGVLFDFEVAVYFKLNTRTDDIEGFKGGTLRKFWEQIGKKYKANTSGGWDKMLNDQLRQIIETSMRQRVFNYTPDELYANLIGEASGTEDAILKIQDDIAKSIKDNINTVLGGQFFCGPTFDRNAKGCPDFKFIIKSAQPHDETTIASYEKQRQSLNNIIVAQNNAQAKIKEAEGTKAAADAISNTATPEYVALLQAQAMQECAKNNNCTLVFNGSSGGVNINTGK